MLSIVGRYHLKKTKRSKGKGTRAKIFWTGRSQAVRLPKEFRFATESVLVRREGDAVVLEPDDTWPTGWAESFAGVPRDFERPTQGESESREQLD
ncbi:MAG: antitoxin [Myxococcales bacterium]